MSTEESVERIANEVLARLDTVGEWLQGSGTEVLEIYTRMAMWDSIGYFAGGFGLLALAAAPAYYSRKCWVDEQNNPSYEAHFIPLGLVAAALGFFGFAIASGGVSRLAVPEYFAIQELLQQVL